MRVIGLVLIGATLLRFAWMSDDALITVRHALNLSHGWGLGFNIDERVQGFTHPLWFGLITLVGMASGAWTVAPIALGIACSTGAAAVVLWSARSLARVVLSAALLLLSNAFIEYGTSGLENALSFLLLAGAVALTARGVGGLTDRRALGLGVLVALALLNRLDLALILVAPVVLAVVASRRSPRRLAALILPTVLLVGGWFIAGTVTYGSALPNTFLAKTNVDIPRTELLVQGIRYLHVSLLNDPVTGIALLTALVLAIACGTGISRCWAAGMVAYVAYVVWIGGDFMAFRFLAAPAIVAIAMIAAVPWRLEWPLPRGVTPAARDLTVSLLSVAAAVIASMGLVLLSWGRADATLSATPVEPRWVYYLEGGVSDERSYYAPFLGLWAYVQALGDSTASVDRGNQGARMVDVSTAASSWPTATADAKVTDVQVQCGSLGQEALLSGPLVHWIDPCGLTDRFLAGRPYVAENYAWRIGHFDRPVPAGYEEAIRVGSPMLMESAQDRDALEAVWAQIR